MKIVVRGANWIGDSVMSVPALRALRQVFPDAEITLHTRSWAEGIFRDADFLDRVITYDKPESSLNEVVAQSRLLRGEQFDVAVIFPNSFASALTARFARIPRRFGYSKEARGFVLTDAIEIPQWKSERHEVYFYLALAEEVERLLLGTSVIPTIEPSISLTVSDERRYDARSFLERKGFDLTRPLIALGPGSTNSMAKRWPAERFAQLVDLLHGVLNANVILLGGGEDLDAGDVICAVAERSPLDLIGKTSLGDATAILAVCDLMISNDMGLAHLAPAVGTRTLAVFGPTNPQTTRPFSDIAEVIRIDVECSPCMLRECPIDHRCMTRISVQQVLEFTISALEKNDRTDITSAGRIHRP